MKVKLIALVPGRLRRRIVLEELPASVGRSPDATLHFDDSWVSRWHCELLEIDGELVVRDLESRHGTFVNGHRVSETRLMPGDKLTIGSTSFQVRYRPRKVKAAVAGGYNESDSSEIRDAFFWLRSPGRPTAPR